MLELTEAGELTSESKRALLQLSHEHQTTKPDRRLPILWAALLLGMKESERDLLRVTAQGMTAKEIGYHFGISERAARQRALVLSRKLRLQLPELQRMADALLQALAA